MILTLDVEETQTLSSAMIAGVMAMQQFPNQEIGSEGAVPIIAQGKEFIVERNENSHTVRESNNEQTP